jgi:hypothetical protein
MRKAPLHCQATPRRRSEAPSRRAALRSTSAESRAPSDWGERGAGNGVTANPGNRHFVSPPGETKSARPPERKRAGGDDESETLLPVMRWSDGGP